MGSLFTALFSKLVAMVVWFKDCVVQVFEDAWEMAVDIVCKLFGDILDVNIAALNLIEMCCLAPGSIPDFWSGTSGEVLNVAGLIGVSEALQVIGCALLIRFVMQMIPFTRWGS